MKLEEFSKLIIWLMTSKNRNIEFETIKVWYELLINKKKYSKIQIQFVVEKLCYSKIDFPTVADIVTILEPEQNTEMEAERELVKIDRSSRKPEEFKKLQPLTRAVFKNVFNSLMDYNNSPARDKSFLKKDFIRLYQLEKAEQKREQSLIAMNNYKKITEVK